MVMMKAMETWRGMFACALLAFTLAGCSWLPSAKDETTNWSAEQLYREAHDALLSGNYTRAVKLFESLEARYPYGRYAQQAILEGAFANWRANEPAAAVANCDRFIRTYPNHPNVDYAFYLRGLVHFREDQGVFGYVYELDLSERDPKEMRASFSAFKELTTRFPESQYYEDAILRMKYLNNALGTYEVKVARYYFNRGDVRRRVQPRAELAGQQPADAVECGCARRHGGQLRQAGAAPARQRLPADSRQDVSGQQVRDRLDREAVVAVLVPAGHDVRRLSHR
jgi:outer membrane protein assembly factor BamD